MKILLFSCCMLMAIALGKRIPDIFFQPKPTTQNNQHTRPANRPFRNQATKPNLNRPVAQQPFNVNKNPFQTHAIPGNKNLQNMTQRTPSKPQGNPFKSQIPPTTSPKKAFHEPVPRPPIIHRPHGPPTKELRSPNLPVKPSVHGPPVMHDHKHQHQHKDPFVPAEATIQEARPAFAKQPALGADAFFCPGGLRVRKEFRDMTWEEWTRYLAAVKRMYEPDPVTGKSKVDSFTRIHLDNADIAHNTAHFLPWHRWFTFLYEEELRKYDPDVTIPYWDWTFDAQAPLKSPLFRPEYLGLKTGRKGDCDWIVSYPRRHCVVRTYTPKSVGTFYGRRTIDRLISDKRMSWSEFAEMFETSPHGIVHFKIGGEGGDLADMASPNDPLFFLHHSMVDYVWTMRQEFTGKSGEVGGRHRGRRAGVKDVLKPFKITVEDTFNYKQRMCYTYQPFSGWMTRAAPAAQRQEYGWFGRVMANIQTVFAGLTGQQPAKHTLPDPLDKQWIDMHGWSPEWIKGIEARLQALESMPLEGTASSANKTKLFLYNFLPIVCSLILLIAF